jgi:hypothetical protein
MTKPIERDAIYRGRRYELGIDRAACCDLKILGGLLAVRATCRLC